MNFFPTRPSLVNQGYWFQQNGRRVHLIISLFLVSFLGSTLNGHTQTLPDSIPGSTEPGRLEKRFDPPTTPRREAPPVKKEPDQEIEPQPGPEILFTLTSIKLEGVMVYTKTELQPLWQDFIGQEVSLADLQTVTIAITAKYRADGYILSRAIVPAQRISQGIVVLRVLEGFIHRVIIEG